MDDQDRTDQLKAIEARIAQAKGHQAPKPRADEHYSQANLAWRMVIELVAGLGIGFGIGYGLDVLFGTLPIFMVLFVMLGLAAGIKTMLRSANEIQDRMLAELAEDLETPAEGETQAPAPGATDEKPAAGGNDHAPVPGGKDQAPVPGDKDQAPVPGDKRGA